MYIRNEGFQYFEYSYITFVIIILFENYISQNKILTLC